MIVRPCASSSRERASSSITWNGAISATRRASGSLLFFKASSGAVFIQAQRPRSKRHDVQHAAQDADVFQEVVQLVLELCRIRRPEIVEDERGRDYEQENGQG